MTHPLTSIVGVIFPGDGALIGELPRLDFIISAAIGFVKCRDSRFGIPLTMSTCVVYTFRSRGEWLSLSLLDRGRDLARLRAVAS